MKIKNKYNHIPDVNIILEIDPLFKRIITPEDSLNRALYSQIMKGTDDILNILGIPGKAVLKIYPLDKEEENVSQFIKIFVNEQACRFSGEFLQRIYSYMICQPIMHENPSQVFIWLGKLYDSENKNDNTMFIEFLTIIFLETLKKQSALLLGTKQFEAYIEILKVQVDETELDFENWFPDSKWFFQSLKEILSLGISIANKKKVLEILKTYYSHDLIFEDFVEDLIIGLQTNVIEIQIQEEYFREIITNDAENELDKFTLLRDGLFYESGIQYPNFKFVLMDFLKPRSFAFKINHLLTLPSIGLESKKIAVNATPDYLTILNIIGTPAINPANSNEMSIIDIDSQKAAESAGLTTWNQLSYLVLSLSADLKENSICFVHKQLVNTYLDQLSSAFPDLVNLVKMKYSLGQITKSLRLLLADEISIRNLRHIIESMLDFDYILTDASKYLIFDDRLPISQEDDEINPNSSYHIVAFIRSCMKQYISHKYTKGGGTLAVYLLDPEIEKMVENNEIYNLKKEIDYQDSSVYDKVLAAFYNVIGYQSQNIISNRVILTKINVRKAVRNIIEKEFPRLQVLSYQELSPDINIHPIARISLNN